MADQTKTHRLEWECRRCHHVGAVKYGESASVRDVLSVLYADHEDADRACHLGNGIDGFHVRFQRWT